MIFHPSAATIIPGATDTLRAISITAGSASDHTLKEKFSLYPWYYMLVILESFLGNKPYLFGNDDWYAYLNGLAEVNLVYVGDVGMTVDYLGTFIHRIKQDISCHGLPPALRQS
jgi:hypothetical protein